jgi:hypothetical protein
MREVKGDMSRGENRKEEEEEKEKDEEEKKNVSCQRRNFPCSFFTSAAISLLICFWFVLPPLPWLSILLQDVLSWRGAASFLYVLDDELRDARD